MLKIPQKIKKIITRIENNGFEAYVVGGAVRDAILGLTPKDYDITTSCPPEKITKIFEKTVPTGIKHGTVTVIIDSIPTEVTTYRIDGSYTNNRSPDSVSFTSNLFDDLSRRDFTINALAFNDISGLIDFFSGQADINNKLVRTVGNPEIRFSEDALRILRAVRFACTLKFEIESTTYLAALNSADRLKSISGERIFTELSKAILGDNTEALEDFINKGGLKSLNITSAFNFCAIKKLPLNIYIRLFAFFKLTDANFDYLSDRLHFNNKLKKYLDKAFYIDRKLNSYDKPHIKNILAYTETEAFGDYLDYKSVVLNENTEELNFALKTIINNKEPYKISMLNITGKDLEKLGFRGEEIGAKLEFLLDKCIENPELNNKKLLHQLLSN